MPSILIQTENNGCTSLIGCDTIRKVRQRNLAPGHTNFLANAMTKIKIPYSIYNSLDTWYQAVIDVIQMTSDKIRIVDEKENDPGVGLK